MNMKILISLLSILLANVFYCQNIDETNLEKYWKYRDQLRQRFMKIGQFDGESIPASAIIPSRQYGEGAVQSNGSIIHWRDAMVSLSMARA